MKQEKRLAIIKASIESPSKDIPTSIGKHSRKIFAEEKRNEDELESKPPYKRSNQTEE